MDAAIVLPTHRPRLLCESVLEVRDHDPLARMAALSYAVESGAAPALSMPAASDKSHRFGAAPGHQRSFDAPIGAHLCCQPGAAAEMMAARQRAAGLSALVAAMEHASVHGGYEGSARRGAGIGATADMGPAGRDAVLSGIGRSVLDILESQSPLEEFIENRFLSAERYTAFLVMFHEMAATVASFAPLRWDTSRSQSCLRVATTAAPISAADLVRTFQAGTAAGLDEPSYHGGVAGLALQATALNDSAPRVSTTAQQQPLAFKPGRYRASLGDIVGAIEGSVRGNRRGGDGDSHGSYSGSMRSAGGALAAMEEGAGEVPWWSAPVIDVASGAVPAAEQ